MLPAADMLHTPHPQRLQRHLPIREGSRPARPVPTALSLLLHARWHSVVPAALFGSKAQRFVSAYVNSR
jgi:hypothetical protein